ncbi:MAG: DUF4411 family protein [Planctomycetales bacterium]|nr:DUF4411 family protein [Planctomycetales bacterium]
MTKFLIDTNSLIDAKDFFYAFDICPGFWNAISRHHTSGEVFSIDHVRYELLDGNDILVRWTRKLPSSFFIPSNTAETVSKYSEIIQWVQANYSRQDAVSSFAAKADGWLIATASVTDSTLVCEEQFNASQQKRVPNPNVCRQFGVPYCNMFEMLRTLRVKFGLRKLP